MLSLVRLVNPSLCQQQGKNKQVGNEYQAQQFEEMHQL
jgi:hypothetical protein